MTDNPSDGEAAYGQRLARTLGFGTDRETLWTERELEAVYKHQLQAPIAVDLSALDEQVAARLRCVAEAQGLLLRSFADLLQHPFPPIELLVLTKNFAKANRFNRRSALPQEVAGVLYYAAIASALVRHHKRITQLTSAELERGVSWALSQPWLDPPTRDLLVSAQAALSNESA